jgi:hypothetical protein
LEELKESDEEDEDPIEKKATLKSQLSQSKL